MSKIGADLFLYEAKLVEHHELTVADGYGETHARFAQISAVIFVLLALSVGLIFAWPALMNFLLIIGLFH